MRRPRWRRSSPLIRQLGSMQAINMSATARMISYTYNLERDSLEKLKKLNAKWQSSKRFLVKLKGRKLIGWVMLKDFQKSLL